MSHDDRRRRPLYAPPPTRSRSTLATYGPLILTVTIATAGALAWIWADRRSSTDDEDGPPSYRREGDQQPGPPPQVDGQESLASRVNAAWARSPSPAQLLGSASAVVSAGVAAVGSGVAAAGSSLGLTDRSSGAAPPAGEKGKRPVRRDGREEGFSDHERWSEEPASPRKAGAGSAVGGVAASKGAVAGKKKKAVAVVVSAEHDWASEEGDPHGIEHTSILSHLVPQFNPATTDMYVLIFAPTSNHAADALNAQASRLLANSPANVLPFATASGYVHMLRHLAPALAYVVDTPHLAGQKGETIAALKGWVGQTVVVVGDDGAGGLVDTETEAEDEAGRPEGKAAPWWEGSDLVGLGKGVEVVDIRRVGDDWVHRVGGN